MEKLCIVQKTQNSSHTNERITDTTQNPNKHFKEHVDTLILINAQFEKTSAHFNKENSQIILRCHSKTEFATTNKYSENYWPFTHLDISHALYLPLCHTYSFK